MYKIVSNNVIMKFEITLNPGFVVEKHEVKFAFQLVISKRKKGSQSEF